MPQDAHRGHKNLNQIGQLLSDNISKNTAPACVLVQSNKYPEAAQDYGSSCAPEANDTVLQC